MSKSVTDQLRGATDPDRLQHQEYKQNETGR
jgi:hypothetical protein